MKNLNKLLDIILKTTTIIVILFLSYQFRQNIINAEKDQNLTDTIIKEKQSFIVGPYKHETIIVKKFDNNMRVNETTVNSTVLKPKNITELYYSNLNKLTKISNPTKVLLSNFKQMEWVGDYEKFFTLIFKTETKLPAYKFSVEIVDNNKTMNFKHSQASNIFYNKPTLTGNNIFYYPLVTKSELAKYLGIKKRKILGVGLDPNIPKKVLNKAIIIKNHSSVYTKSLGLKYSYTTIFDDNSSTLTGLYIYLDKN